MLSKHHKKSLVGIKSLSMMKMEKNFLAQDKGYPRKPYNCKNQTLDFLLDRLENEYDELCGGFEDKNFENMLEELADMSNIIDYLYEKILNELFKQRIL